MQQQLARTLTKTDLVLLLVGTVIGSGIFLVPGGVLQQSGGHVGLALSVWLLGGILSLLGALTYGELGARDSASGGLYIYIRDAFGRLPAFLYGWTLFFVISSGSLATLAVAFSRYLDQLIDLSPLVARLVAVAVIVLVTVINVVGYAKQRQRPELDDRCKSRRDRRHEHRAHRARRSAGIDRRPGLGRTSGQPRSFRA